MRSSRETHSITDGAAMQLQTKTEGKFESLEESMLQVSVYAYVEKVICLLRHKVVEFGYIRSLILMFACD
jgi:hypothetical protein